MLFKYFSNIDNKWLRVNEAADIILNELYSIAMDYCLTPKKILPAQEDFLNDFLFCDENFKEITPKRILNLYLAQ